MGCCGQNRKQYHNTTANGQAARIPGPPASGTPQDASGETTLQEPVGYEYTGTASLTIRGAVTGNIYRFRNHGDRVAIDIRDVPTIDSIPDLRRI